MKTLELLTGTGAAPLPKLDREGKARLKLLLKAPEIASGQIPANILLRARLLSGLKFSDYSYSDDTLLAALAPVDMLLHAKALGAFVVPKPQAVYFSALSQAVLGMNSEEVKRHSRKLRNLLDALSQTQEFKSGHMPGSVYRTTMLLVEQEVKCTQVVKTATAKTIERFRKVLVPLVSLTIDIALCSPLHILYIKALRLLRSVQSSYPENIWIAIIHSQELSAKVADMGLALHVLLEMAVKDNDPGIIEDLNCESAYVPEFPGTEHSTFRAICKQLWIDREEQLPEEVRLKIEDIIKGKGSGASQEAVEHFMKTRMATAMAMAWGLGQDTSTSKDANALAGIVQGVCKDYLSLKLVDEEIGTTVAYRQTFHESTSEAKLKPRQKIRVLRPRVEWIRPDEGIEVIVRSVVEPATKPRARKAAKDKSA